MVFLIHQIRHVVFPRRNTEGVFSWLNFVKEYGLPYILTQKNQLNNSQERGEVMSTVEVRNRLPDRTWMETARRIKGLSQKAVADAAGCSEVYYNRIEKGLQTPKVDIGVRITDFLGVDVHNFLNEKTLSQ